MKKLFTIAAAAAVMLCFSAFSAAAADSPDSEGEGTVISRDQEQEQEQEQEPEPEPDPYDLSQCEVSFKYKSYTFTGKAITPDSRNGADEVTVTLNGKVLAKGRDYLIGYRDNINVGYNTAVLTVTGIGDYNGSKEAGFTIKPAKATLTKLTTSKGNIRASWEPVADALGYQVLYSIDPSFVNEVHSTTVTNRTYVNLTNVPKVGECWFVKVRAFITSDGTVSGVRYGNYSKAKNVTVRGNIGSVTMPYQAYTYKGKEIKPALTVTDTKGYLLSENDYNAVFENNINVGTAKVTVKGKGLYSGTFITTFTVKPNDLSDNRATIPALEYIYAGSPVKPKPTLKVSGIKLTRNSDYYVTYSNNDAVGTATVTLTGLGNFSGTTSRTYSIVKAAAGKSTVNGTTYYADSKGNVERSVTDGVISYSDKYLNKYAKKQITAGGYAISTALPRVDIDTISRGASSRKINITWKHFMDDRYSSYLLLRGDTEGKKWTVLGEIPASDSDKDYKYTDNIKSENSRFFRYALAGVSVRDGKKYAGQLTFDVGWAKVKLCLDPGHYIGCNANSEYSEGTQMLLLGGKLKDSLTSTKLLGTAFATVKITRTGDGVTETFAAGVPNEKFIGYGDGYGEALMARGKYSKGCDYFISLHTNATSTNSWYTSDFWEVQCYINNVGNANSFDWQVSYELGKAASKTIAPGGKTVESRAAFKDRNVINRHVSANGDTYRLGDTYYAVTRAADRVGVPGVLIEHSFHTNPEVRKWMLSDENLAKLAKAETKAILRQYGFPIEK